MPSKNLNKALANGHQVVMSPNWYVYLDYAQAPGEPGAPWNGNINGPNSLELIYNWEAVPDALQADKEALILGIEKENFRNQDKRSDSGKSDNTQGNRYRTFRRFGFVLFYSTFEADLGEAEQ